MTDNTIRVRIAVSVDHTGDWSCAGFKGADESDLHSYTIDTLEPGEARYWVEVELPVPTGPTTVQGSVSDAQGETHD